MVEYFVSLSVELVAAFLGFLFALLLDNMLDRKRRMVKTKLAIENLISELEDIQSGLNNYIINNYSVTFKIQIPSWEALQYSGMTIELIEYSYYQELITAYSLIQNYNDLLLFRKIDAIGIGDIKNVIECIGDLLEKMKGSEE